MELGISWALVKTKKAGPRLDWVEGAGWHQDKAWDPVGRWWWPRPPLARLVGHPRVLGLTSASPALLSGQWSGDVAAGSCERPAPQGAALCSWHCPCCASC